MFTSCVSVFKALQSLTQGRQVLLCRQGEYVRFTHTTTTFRHDLSQPRLSLRVTIQDLINKAILASVSARREWDLKPVQDRAQILFKAADVISGAKRAEVLAKTMLGQVLRLGGGRE